MKQAIILHWSELQLKGTNRPFFERALVNDIKKRLSAIGMWSVKKGPGKIVVTTMPYTQSVVSSMRKHGPSTNNSKDSRFRGNDNIVAGNDSVGIGNDVVLSVLQKIPGIANVCPGMQCRPDIEQIKLAAVEVLNDVEIDQTFKIEATRSDKSFIKNSMEIMREVGEYVLNEKKLKVDVHNPDITINVEVDKGAAYVHAKKIDGHGGLPVGTSGKVVSLLSGGIDSPVASWMMMRRGCKVIGVHFQNNVSGQTGVQDKIEQLTGKLAEHQGNMKTYVIPFGELQRRVVMKVSAKLRMLVYRCIMLKIAEYIARKEKAGALITGDSVGQVASQTLENIAAVHHGCTKPILSPLIGTNKKEIVDVAQSIGTYDISILPYDDCCSMFVPKHPETHARVEDVSSAVEEVALSEEEIKEIIEKSSIVTK